MEDPESDALQHMLHEQQSHKLFCPDCDACITHDTILRKRKANFDEPSTSNLAEYSEDSDEEYSDDPDYVLPQVLLEQETHDLFCPICEYDITDKVILEQKRKREPDSELRGSFADAVDRDEFYMRSVLQQQSSFELSCPDCEACITHEVILHKRKSPASSDAATGGTPWPHEKGRSGLENIAARQRQKLKEIRRVDEITEEFEHPEQDDPPSKRQRKVRTAAADQEDDELRKFFQEQTSHDLTCPDCNSLITYQVILQQKSRKFRAKPRGSEDTIGLQDKGRRQPRKFINVTVDKNPWKTRYKSYYGSLRGTTAHESRDDTRSRVAKYGAVSNRSLTEPLLSEQGGAALRPMTIVDGYQDFGENFYDNWRNNLIYFATLLFLWIIWLILRYI